MTTHAGLTVRKIALKKALPHELNPRDHPPKGTSEWETLKKSLLDEYFDPMVWNRRNGKLVSGHYRRAVLLDEGFKSADMVVVDWDEPTHLARMIAANELLGTNNEARLLALVREIDAGHIDADQTGLTPEKLKALLALTEPPPVAGPVGPNLSERFGVPPFSVLDARQGYWQERKRQWLTLGIRSEVGRGDNLLKMSDTALQPDVAKRQAATYAKAFNTQDLLTKNKRSLGATPQNENSVLSHAARDKTMPRGKAKASLKGGLTFGTAIHPYDGQKDQFEQPQVRLTPGGGGGAWMGADGQAGATGATGTSIFDPVLSELCYRWFCPPGGEILDPFCGGSVRGVVAAALGRNYTGLDLRPEQVAANAQQWAEIEPRLPKATSVSPITADPAAITPVERREGLWFKRDDLFCFKGAGAANGAKVRTMLKLAVGAKGLIACGDRVSTQIPRAAIVGKLLGLPVRIHCASGEFTEGMKMAQAHGAEIVQHKAGYLNVVRARAKADAVATGYTEVPWAVECTTTVEANKGQVANLPKEINRLVVVVGSGMALSAILTGLAEAQNAVKVLGVIVGGDRKKIEARLDTYAPPQWRTMVELVKADSDYHTPATECEIHGVVLDPYYEAKTIKFLEPGDCLWVVGVRETPTAKPISHGQPKWVVGDSQSDLPEIKADFLFSCPPYADLEVYSDDPKDLSTMSYPKFLLAYRAIIKASCERLKADAFACFVVGDLRDKQGNYRNFVGETIAAFLDAGLTLYNEAILVTAVGSLSIRVGRQFASGRKLGKTHQNVLVFLKGDSRKAVAKIGEVEFGQAVEVTP